MNKEKYNAALKNARYWLEFAKNHNNKIAIQILEEIFPEMQASKNEKIKRTLIDLVETIERSGHKSFNNVSTSSLIAWLEKQGNIVKYYEDKLDKCACDNFNKGYKKALEKQAEQPHWKPSEEQLQTLHAQLNEGAVTYSEDKRILSTLYEDLMKMTKEEKQGEQKPIPKFTAGDRIRYRGEKYQINSIEKTANGLIYNVSVIGKPSDPLEVKTAIGSAGEKDMEKIIYL